MTDSELKTLCVNAMERPHDAGIGLYVVLRQVLTLDPEPLPPPKSKGAELAELAVKLSDDRESIIIYDMPTNLGAMELTTGCIRRCFAAAIDKAIADERYRCIRIAGYHSATVAERMRENLDQQEETRT